MSTATAPNPTTTRKPRDDEIDVWGLTHPGKVRKNNQDHFLLGSLHKRLEIRASSLPPTELLQARDERIGFLAMVADGVGGHAAGEEASRLALEEVTLYVAQSTRCYYDWDSQAADFTGKWLLVNTIASSSRTGGATGPDDPSYRSPGLWVPGCMTAPMAAVFTPVVPSVS